MQYRILGRTGIKVSQLCFGTMSFGGDADDETAKAMFHSSLDAGINFFDCANTYVGGHSEEILGKLMAAKRDELVITTKVCSRTGPGINERGLARRHIMQQVENSLRRLQTDRIDVYFLHHFDPDTPMEETLQALDDLVRQGKIIYPAVSNWAAWQIARALGVSAQQGWARFQCIQPMYSLVKRQVEVEILPLAQAENIGVVPYSPLGGGLLSGKYSPSDRPNHGRLVDNKMYVRRYADEQYFEVAQALKQHADDRGHHPVTVAVAWVMSHPGVTAPIIGARNLEQLEPSLAAAELNMDAAWRQEISNLSYQPPLATDRAEEQG